MIKGIVMCLAVLILFNKAQAQNYDESKVPAYTLPEVLASADGTVVDNKAAWEKKRRPEVLRLFENNVYGQMPQGYDSIAFTLTNDVVNAMDGQAHLKEVTITVWRKNKSADINLVLFVPTKPQKPVPAFLLINNRDKSNTDPSRTTKSAFWPAEMVIDSGYAVAAFHVSDAAPDNKDTYQEGALQLYPEQEGADNGTKAIGAWAWAASRVMDYFQEDKDIDARRVAVVGHSRGGKAALWAGAQDQRFAMVYSNCSGNTGAALSRRRFGETVKVINDQFPHWFADNYKKYNENEAALPVDQHMLLSLIAPRPVYVTSATEDLWADPKGSYLSLLHAQKAYKLYRRHSALTPEPPAVNSPIINSYLGYHNREGAHDLTKYDWANFIQFANYHASGQH
ncbi:acetylxylan esterase [Pontibacter diazotrophicus]|uniref:Acetylxylan esterase n=1 Tax=Pontibacter diazotrophicus TaxID=1400979 RepID=A0A3D8L6J4_9BACT|nr:prolyl oligopeptidase family serine peptidase [Pontibacter diazotrophicus]RDV12943.1 acetylxylan esterase [Pontibacter diazotrophicus]